MNKPIVILAGFGSVAFGISIIIKPDFYDRLYDFYWDFREAKWPVALFFVLFGLALIWFGFRKKSGEFEDRVLICPKCREPYSKKDVPDERCPRCEVELEDLEGFYERHPELKKAEPKANETTY